MSRQNSDDAFEWLDEHMVESLDTPDEAHDWVFMLDASGWALIESVWEHRPSKWREALAYIVNDGPIRESQTILRRALFDTELNVAAEAAISLCHHYQLEPELVEVGPDVVVRLRTVFDQNAGKHMEAVATTLDTPVT